MSLIKCPECKKKISDTVSFCPNCGATITDHIKEHSRIYSMNSILIRQETDGISSLHL